MGGRGRGKKNKMINNNNLLVASSSRRRLGIATRGFMDNNLCRGYYLSNMFHTTIFLYNQKDEDKVLDEVKNIDGVELIPEDVKALREGVGKLKEVSLKEKGYPPHPTPPPTGRGGEGWGGG